MKREDLHGKIDRLNDQEAEVVGEFVDALLAPVSAELLPGSWLATKEWSEAFLARLRAHHALSREPLSTTQFEAAFEAACMAAGWGVVSSASATQRFFDTTILVPGQVPMPISLKASSASDMRKTYVHISKLTEAAWIQDTRKQADRQARIVELFADYRKSTYSIIILRGFKEPDGVQYELIEIPTELFEAVEDLDLASAQLATIPVPVNSVTPYMKIRVDRSDAKITLTGIQLSVCDVHCRWKLESQH
nr:hypothetical protein [uncultured Rhodococcus sp.]